MSGENEEAWGEKALILDAMLGSLAKRLRLMGVDVLYMRDEEDGDIVKLAKDTGRWVVTRDVQLAQRVSRSFLINTTDPEDGWSILVAWLRNMGVEFRPGTRCSVCNTLLEIADPKGASAETVPGHIIDSGQPVWLCKGCGRFYWKGSHWDGIMEHAPPEMRDG
ncbi:MAG: Mut7-C RNAse domain-containing protein [Candidatus Thermoplasmatota archaeon]|nr:Mut7-C RNAse domain-containing protein [Candidatus Thermoplasmatota archaeon]